MKMKGILMSRIKTIRIITLLFLLTVITEIYSESNQIIHINSDIRLKPLTENVWVHVSDIVMTKWGKVSANGMAIITDGQLVIIDTPWNDTLTQLLVKWFEDNYEIKEIKVIVTHYVVESNSYGDWPN